LIWVTFVMALREVRRHALRSFLTMLGIVIGVGAVITMVTIGKGATAQVTAQVSSLGDDVVLVRPGADRRGPGGVRDSAEPFELADVAAIRREVLGVEAVTGSASRAATVVFGNANWPTTVTGCDGEYLTVRGFTLAAGRDFSSAELAGGAPVCVVGETVREKIYGDVDPVGTRLRVGSVSCLVVGRLAEKGEAVMGMDLDDTVLMPLTAFQRRIAGNQDVAVIQLKARRSQSIAVVQGQVEALMTERRRIPPGQEKDFTVRNVQELANAMSAITTTLTGLLGGIAAVSLLVGGIGIMNIMLVSVTERTREIGTRLAIGALASEVLLQFLVEAIVLSVLGGVIGIGFGLGLSFVAARALTLPFVVAPDVVVGAFVFSALVGVVFGYLPARQAARLNPIEALRHE
jgi:putative ABC transport system permease protein